MGERLKQIEQRRLRIQEELGRAQEIYWVIKRIEQGENELKELAVEEETIKVEMSKEK